MRKGKRHEQIREVPGDVVEGAEGATNDRGGLAHCDRALGEGQVLAGGEADEPRVRKDWHQHPNTAAIVEPSRGLGADPRPEPAKGFPVDHG